MSKVIKLNNTTCHLCSYPGDAIKRNSENRSRFATYFLVHFLNSYYSSSYVNILSRLLRGICVVQI